ncbi:MAG: T9SS C-terminal target domain-containing protein [Calditrichaeota bacterium]|nr:MAG: T9SS C-terminal target domain-containing protein [Calditrichota bacterium]
MLLASPEAFEGLLVRIANADTVAGGGNWPAEGDNMNLTITDDGGISTITMRIDKDTDIDGSPEPVYPITLTGVVSQYDGSAPYTEGYQIFPRRMEDIESANAIDNTPVVQPLSFKLYSAYPNPFNPSTTLAFDIPADMAGERVSLAVYNVLGQQMTMLVDKPLSAGHYAMTWNGLTSRGMQAPTGVYFAILKAGGQQKTTRLLLIK